MRFMYPLGLLGLIGIPVLIIIYLIKNKHTEQTVASTYLWTLSEKFLKRKKRVNPIAGLISLLLQILAVTAISLAIAHPVFVLPNQAQEYCFIIDASASMNMEKDGATRLDRAKTAVEDYIKDSVDGSVYTLVYMTDTTNYVYERTRDKEDALEGLSQVLPGYVETDENSVIGLAQEYFNANTAIHIYYFTDCAYSETENIEVVDLSAGERNLSLSNLQKTDGKDELTISGTVTAYEYAEAQEVALELYINNGATPAATQTLTVATGEPLAFSFTEEVASFSSARVVLKNTDALALDNESVLYSVESENSYDALIVSDTPFLIRAAIEASGNADVTVISTKEYDGQRGYGLYVFDSYSPSELPEDGSVWFININESVPGAGFSVQSEVALETGEELSLSTSSSYMVKKLTKDMIGEGVYITKYMSYGRYRNFTTLMTYKSNPVIFTGVDDNGNREVVFAFDIHASDFSMHPDFSILVRNLLDYSFPLVIEEVAFSCGDTLSINNLPNTESVRVETESGNKTYLSVNGAVSEYVFDEVGVHKITTIVAGTQRDYYVYANVPAEECVPHTEAKSVTLQGEATDGGLDGSYDALTIVFIVLAVFFIADWAVYCYEKYQLR